MTVSFHELLLYALGMAGLWAVPGPVWVALMIIGAASGVALGQQCARRPMWVLPALAKLATASALPTKPILMACSGK